MTLHYLIISSVKEIIMNNYSFFQVVGGDGGVFDMIVLYIILKFFLKAVNYMVMLGSALYSEDTDNYCLYSYSFISK